MGRPTSRRGISLLEVTLSLAAATILSVGLGSSLVVATRGLALSTSADGQRIDTTRIAREAAQDFQQATRFTEQTPTAVTFLVPDRNADGRPDAIRYAWSGVAGAPLTYSLNGAAAMEVATGVQGFNLTYGAQAMTAPAPPEESLASGVKLLYVTGGSQVQTFGYGAAQRTATGPMVLASPSSNDRKKIELFESWGYDLTYVLPNEPWDNLSSLIEQSQVVFISCEADSSSISPNIYNSTKGVVIERASEYDDARFASNETSFSNRELRVRTPNHFIVDGYGSSQVIQLLSSNSTFYRFENVGSGVTNVLGPVGRSEPCLMTLSPGDRMSNSARAVGRRVLIPWGFPGFNCDNLTTDGRLILRRCLEWGAGAGSDPNSPVETFGNTAVYMSLMNAGTGRLVATKVNLPRRGKIQSITAFCGGGVGTIRYAVYSHDHGQNKPHQMLTQSGVGLTLSGANRWVTLNVNDTTLNAGDYWLAVCCGLSSQTINMTPGGDLATLNHDATLSGFKSSWGASNSQEKTSFSIYGTYEPN